jgi:glycosyltransferase involved in cell wall biosynthesis
MLVAAAPGIPFTLALPLLLGEFQGAERFTSFALLLVLPAWLKLIAAAVLGAVLGSLGIVAGISLGAAVAYVIAHRMLLRELSWRGSISWWRPAMSYLAVILPSTLALSVLLSADVLFVKHWFPKSIAGEYAAVAALGRAIFWVSSGIAAVLFPKVIRQRARGESGARLVSASLLLVALGGLIGLILVSLSSTWLLTSFAGASYAPAAAYLPLYALAMTTLGGAAVLITTYQSRGRPAFLVVLLPLTALELVLLTAFHQSISQVVGVVNVSMASIFVGLAALTLVEDRIKRPEPVDGGPRTAFAPAGLSEVLAKRPLRILILNWRCPEHPHAGGAERFTLEVARRLVGLGHSVEWFSGSFPGASPEDEIDGIRMIRAGSSVTVYWHAFRRYHKSLSERFDVVIDEVNAVPFFAPLWSGLPTFMLIHQLEREVWWYQAAMPLSAIGFLAEPVFMRAYRRTPVFTISASTESELRRLGFVAPITVLPIGSEHITAPDVAKAEEPTFLYVGRLVPSKRIEHMLMALSRFRLLYGSGALWLVGRGYPRYERALVKLAQQLGIAESVKFWGHVGSQQKHNLMAEAHALLMTSVREGWGLVVTEANACGTPAIVYDVPGLRDSVRHEWTGLVVEPQPDKLSDAMLRVARDASLYGRLVAGARLWSATHSYEDTARAVGRVLEAAPPA